MLPAELPRATYRLQFHAGFTFADASAITDYLDSLGISHCYASSYFRAVPGSPHGYDVADPTRLNPEIGDDESHATWVQTLRAHGMGHIVDLVPNHMGIARSANPWWQDVLENGPSSRYAQVFDIDWHPLKPELEHKVLLPVLGDSYGAVLERQELTLRYENGAFSVRYHDHVFPLAPGTYDRVLAPEQDALIAALGAGHDDAAEFLSILTAIRHLPGRQELEPARLAERDREKEVIKRRLAALTARAPQVLLHVERAVTTLNGVAGTPASFDALDRLLSAQPYRLSYWRVAAEEINYRRFFDINELAAVRVEVPSVFDMMHACAFDLFRRGLVDGFRIDHVDGLFDPGDYLQRLQARARELRAELITPEQPLFVVVEKILDVNEPLPDWPVAGTTGYEFLVMVNGLFVDARNERAMNSVYERFTRLRAPYREIVYRGKQLILRVSMASELNVLAFQLNRFSERSRHYRDFTLNSLMQAMREIIACFPVYRTYVNDREPAVSDRDRHYIEHAVREAKRRNPNRPFAVYDFVRDVLLQRADYIPPSERDEHLRFVGKFQQLTSPITAKGIEDTALYIYNRLASLNEVGGHPDTFGTAPDALHRWLATRADRWPHGLSATATHDTKRGEDVRARINVLSEVPGAWKQATAQWARLNRRGRTMVEGQSYPSRNEEYLLYQTLVGSWPLEPVTDERRHEYRERIIAYMHKAMREAKVFTSWLNPSPAHEDAMARFIHAVLAPDNTAFLDSFLPFAARVARYGIYNSLAQAAVKIGAPGIPDFYQGTELWDLALVDPDNRRLVDYAKRRSLLAALDRQVCAAGRLAVATELAASPADDRMKLYATATMLRLRRARRAVFDRGRYAPVASDGPRRDHVFAFTRDLDDHRILVVVPRLVATLLPDADAAPLGERVWGDTQLILPEGPAGPFRDAFTDAPVAETGDSRAGVTTLRVADLLAHFPIGVLETR